MNKAFVYIAFIVACLTELAVFVTTTTYTQLGIAAILYPFLVYFALKVFPRKENHMETIQSTNTEQSQNESPLESSSQPLETEIVENDEEIRDEDVKITDIDRRAFIKLIGATGITFFLTSLFSRKLDDFLLGKEGNTGVTTIQNISGTKINPATHQPTDDYRISEVEYGISSFFGFVNRAGGWYIMREDTEAGTFRYVKGEVNFSINWDNREHLIFDQYNKVFLA